MPQEPSRPANGGADTVELLVRRVDRVGDDTIALVLADAAGRELPAWKPGAHIDLVLNETLTRQYSLCGDPDDRSAWRLGILREPKSRGGSEYLHDRVEPGSRLLARGPRNHFELRDSERYEFVAGGIGITPILPMIRQVAATGAEWRLLYGGRRRTSMAFLDELETYGDRVLVRPQDEFGLLDLTGFLADAPAGSAVYCCGPEPLIAATETVCAARPALRLHVERFTPVALPDDASDTEFEVECAESGLTVSVPPGTSILQAVREAGIEVLSSCSEGTCGTCETDVLEGTPEHRDSVLTPEERKAGESMMICVSRCRGRRLVLDL
ncbi:PDR/VanB family oxidoreductase [Amycolatopsis acidiphila]|uniref:Oxidoreductase n=1 Tax=Amycolatopsis acidiphila TaxID=715473 RepID=A0A558AIP8_9PSEU|nr:PDR/VanB family oxidoreductase [Amycolatopsis acidiphila]TVT24119.1 oxidoreductase [Amycolatopsis acidiphila]UIJ57720.1 PDR/VanB family oxidoreductase [Amycolatopsis acidiphila]GHG87280.1 ferredoxin [Amycolatopsis acidiphila]